MNRFVYILHAEGTDFYKIGTSFKPESRISGVQNGCPFRVRLAQKFECGDPELIERSIHHFLKDQRQRGEWFALTPNEVIAISRDIPVLAAGGTTQIPIYERREPSISRRYRRKTKNPCKVCGIRKVQVKKHKVCRRCYQWLRDHNKITCRPYVTRPKPPQEG